MLKKVLLGVLLIIIAILSWNWKWLIYGYQQGKGQLKIILNARPIDEFLIDPEFPDSLKTKLQLAKMARLFAIDSLGLHQSQNYTKLYDQQGKVLLWNLSASLPYKLEAYEWEYPFLGAMPYKGFFDLERAKAEAEKLKLENYDVRVRPVGGWSTLGFLTDPLLSNMLEKSDGELAEIIIHELTHATIFIRDEIEFNENLASFIGELGAEKFLIATFGDSSNAHISYLHELQDSKTFTQLILAGAKSLDSLYQTFGDKDPIDFKDSLKLQTIHHIKSQLQSTAFHDESLQSVFNHQLPNNAYFMAFRRYHNQEDTLQRIYQSHGNNLPQMINFLKDKYGK